MARKLIYLINPISGIREKNSLKDIIESKTKIAKLSYEILPTLASGDYHFLEKKIDEEKITDIVVCGGDGSVNQVVHALAQKPVNFGIIPLGSGNGLALAANIPKNVDKALEIIFTGKPKDVDGFMVNDQFACMLCGLGFDAVVAHEFALQSKRGLGAYASLTTKKFFSAKGYSFSIRANKVSFDAEASFISIANSNQFGNNFTIAPQALLADGLLDIVIVKNVAKPLLLFNVVKQILAGRLQKVENSLNSPVIYFQTDEITIKNIDDAPMHIDGEPRESMKTLKIKVLPKYFRLLQLS